MIKHFCYILISTFILVSCGKNSLENEIMSLVNIVGHEKTLMIFVADTDCAPCLEKYINYKNSEDINIRGFYYSREPKEFLIKLNKVNNNITWSKLDNRDLIDKIKKRKNVNGPYEILIADKQVLFNN